MKGEECAVGRRVRINMPLNPTLNGETGVICNTDGQSEVSVRFDKYKKKFDNFDDTRCGFVTVEPWELELI